MVWGGECGMVGDEVGVCMEGLGWRACMEVWGMEGVCVEGVVCWVCGMEGIGWSVKSTGRGNVYRRE